MHYKQALISEAESVVKSIKQLIESPLNKNMPDDDPELSEYDFWWKET